MQPSGKERRKLCLFGPGHVTKMVTMPKYGNKKLENMLLASQTEVRFHMQASCKLMMVQLCRMVPRANSHDSIISTTGKCVCVCVCVCVCIPILVTTFPEWLSGMEPLPQTPGAVHLSSLCL